jgi:hypothetical protein
MDMLQDFLVPEGGLQNTPSRKDGVMEELESNLRIYGCELIQQAGILLKLYPLFCCSRSFIQQTTSSDGDWSGSLSQILLSSFVCSSRCEGNLPYYCRYKV